MKTITVLEEKLDYIEWNPKATPRLNSELPGIEGPAVQRWLDAHGRRMPLVMLTQQGKPTVVSDLGEAAANGAIQDPPSLRMLEKRIEFVCEFWTGWCARVQ
jgi:DNA-binding response OmpR family regulator